MGKQKPISRKSFIQVGTVLILGFVGWIWHRLSGFLAEQEKNQEFRFGDDLPPGVSYFEKFYLFKTESEVRAFSTICTHAGCRIGKSNGKVIHCSCHGSQFEASTGKPVKGPAFKTLQEFECLFDEKNKQWVVRLNRVVSKSSLSSDSFTRRPMLLQVGALLLSVTVV